MVSFKRLRDLKKVSFVRHLITLPYHMMNSASTGIFAGQIAVRLAGLATAVVIGTTTALTTTGSLIISIVGGIVGIIAITTGILGLANEHSKNTETLKTIIGSDTEPGQDYQLKIEVAKLLSSADQHDPNRLGEILFYLHGIEGENFTEKLCNLFDVEYIRSHDTMRGKFQNPANTPTPQQLLGVKIIDLLTTNKTEWTNVPQNLLSILTKAEHGYQDYISFIKKDLAKILSRAVDVDEKKQFLYDKNHIQVFIDLISKLPGENLNAKIACLYGVDPKYSSNIDELVEKIRENEPHIITDVRTQFENIRHLNRVVHRIAEQQYLSILLKKSQGADREDSELNRKIGLFKKTLSLIEGDDYDQKIENVFTVDPIERKLRDEGNKEINDARKLDPDLSSKLSKAKKEFDYDHSTVFFRPLSYMQDLFYAFSGSLTGFGIVTSIAAFTGVGIATSGIGLIVLIAAIASAVLGFTLAYLVQRYTRNYSNSFKKETDATTELTLNATNKAKELNYDIQNRPAVSPLPKPRETLPTEALIHRQQFQLEKENREARERIRLLEMQLAALEAKSPDTSSPTTESTSQNHQSKLSMFSAQREASQENRNNNLETLPQPPVSDEAKSGDKRQANEEPTSPPPPSYKRTHGDNGDDNKT